MKISSIIVAFLGNMNFTIKKYDVIRNQKVRWIGQRNYAAIYNDFSYFYR